MQITFTGSDWQLNDFNWVYKKSFPIGEDLAGRRIHLIFEGVGCQARFFLNGERLGEHNSMYTPAVFEVGDLLRYGQDNLLAVVIDPARFDHPGIWDAVYLDVTGPARLEGVHVRPQLSASLDRAHVPVSVDLSVRWPAHQPPGFPAQAGGGSRGFKAFPVEVEVIVALRFEGQVVASQQAQCDISYGGGRLNLKFDLDAPRLWWPNARGEGALYEVEVRVMEPPLPGRPGQFESDRRRVAFGIRMMWDGKMSP
jgi:beta-mannosidase